jgi:hypothetical protein
LRNIKLCFGGLNLALNLQQTVQSIVKVSGFKGAFMQNDKVVLLFYDGHERRAEPKLLNRVKATIRRHVRYVRNRLMKKQMRSGFYTWFFMLREALQRSGYIVKVNDFETAKRNPDLPIGLAGYPTVFRKVDGLRNPRLIGPGIYSSPLENRTLFDDPRNVLFLQTCQWFSDLFAPYYGDRLRPWFGGFDVAKFADVKTQEKKYDVLIYDKIYFERATLYDETISIFINYLKANGLTWKVIRYGSYSYEDYLGALSKSRVMAFFAHSETQGMAYQECLAMNVPIFAWDEGRWMDPMAKELSDAPVPCTSVPYFDARCGEKFKKSNMLDVWKTFWVSVDQYEPRAYIFEQMTLARSAEAYMKAYLEAGRNS